MTGADLGLYELKVEVAFTTAATATSPTYVDVTAYVEGFTTSRGRGSADELCQPGECEISFDNTDGRFEPDKTTGPYYGYLRPNRKVRISAKITSGGTRYYLFTGYADSWRPQPNSHVTLLKATDRFKLLARRSNTGTTVEEQADDRIVAIVEAGGGANVIVPSAERSINADNYACRTLIAYVYDASNTLQNLQDVALSDGGALFMDGEGKLVFQSTRFRTDNTRATTSQGTFGNYLTAIPVSEDIEAAVDDTIMANRILVTDGLGTVHVSEDTTAQANDGILELDLGATLLRAADAPDRAADVLLLRKDPRPRYDTLTIDCIADAAAMTQALSREISDRITIAIIPPGQSTGYSRDQYIESVAHEVSLQPPAWTTTFGVSGGYGGATAIP